MQLTEPSQPELTLPQALWFRALRSLALCSGIAIVVTWYVAILHERCMEKSELLIPFYFAPLWAPYGWIFFRLKSKAESSVRRKALALAFSWGVLGFLLFSAVFLLMASSVGFSSSVWEAEVVFGGLALLQLLLIAASIRAYLSAKPQPGDGRILLWRLGPASCIVLTFFLATPFLHLEKPTPNEATAIGCLRTINVAQSVYAEGHHDRGFAASLRDLGPSPGAELIDEVLATGRKSGYTITISAAPPDAAGRIKAYTVVARPQRFGKDGTRSFSPTNPANST